MTTILLVRHALCDPVGHSIAGRMQGVHLNAEGREQCAALAQRLATGPLSAVYTSPMERARETAEAIAGPRSFTPCVHEGLNEIDFGEWTGRSFAELEHDSLWHRFNSFRGGTRIPGGEMMIEAQARAVAAVTDLAERHRSQTIAAVSHGDVIRGILLHYLGMPLDFVHRLVVEPASVNVLDVSGDGARVSSLSQSEPATS